MGSGYIQIHNRNTKVERDLTENCKQKMKENNDNLWSVTPEEQCRQILNKEEREKQKSDECEMLREQESSLSFYVTNSEENLIRGVVATEKLNTEDNVACGEFRKQKAQELKPNQCENKMHGYFVREMPEKIDDYKTWQQLSKSDLKIGTETSLCAVQKHVVKSNYVKHHIDNTS